MKLYEFGISRSLRAHWILRETGLDYESVSIDLTRGEQRSPEFLAVNPYGKLPVLETGEGTLFESAAICTWIAGRYPESGLIPPEDSIERGYYYQWICFCLAEMEPHLWSIRKNMMLYPKERRSRMAIRVGREEYLRAIDILSAHLAERPCLLGERFSAADIVMVYDLIWAHSLKLLADHPVLIRYMETHMARPAFPIHLVRDPVARGIAT